MERKKKKKNLPSEDLLDWISKTWRTRCNQLVHSPWEYLDDHFEHVEPCQQPGFEWYWLQAIHQPCSFSWFLLPARKGGNDERKEKKKEKRKGMTEKETSSKIFAGSGSSFSLKMILFLFTGSIVAGKEGLWKADDYYFGNWKWEMKENEGEVDERRWKKIKED